MQPCQESCPKSSPCASDTAPNYYIDTSGSAVLQEFHFYFYDRHTSSILGETRRPPPEPLVNDSRYCFNCGSPDHTISSCPEPHNRPLITLSRQLFNFLHPDSQISESGRFHVVEAWKQQRLEWLEFFQPGEVVGHILREALGLQHGDSGDHCPWLHKMSRWGYPVGWIGDTDPRDVVRRRILEGFRTAAHESPSEDADHSFFIFSDEQGHEVMNLTLPTSSCPNRRGDETSTSHDTSSADSDSELPSPTLRRWAIYPATYFSSERLTVYNGIPLTPSTIATARPGNTFTAERKALWQQIISESHVRVPPWRLAGILQSHDKHQSPPPTSNLLLPPPPPPFPPPPLPPLPCPYQFVTAAKPDDPNDSEMDMELSDDE